MPLARIVQLSSGHTRCEDLGAQKGGGVYLILSKLAECHLLLTLLLLLLLVVWLAACWELPGLEVFLIASHELLGLEVMQRLPRVSTCLLYTSDAADEEDSGDLGCCRIIKKKMNG
eukprot:TRINITY_DN1456_c0_g1_i4.p1 TRINITY_DN1456_c0_g1~~TRINITY_DN1456_c0_g1_i4.p1  ORF type:complete len:116 (+),score=9.24 TRINITY_DN1456_c0_g1_i4:127-474(+)